MLNQGRISTSFIRKIILALLLILISFTTYLVLDDESKLANTLSLKDGYDSISNSAVSAWNNLAGKGEKVDAKHSFWNEVFATLKRNSINLTGVEIEYTSIKPNKKEKVTRKNLLSRAIILPETVQEFKNKHERVIEELPSKLSEDTYNVNTSGIVFVGGGKFTWLTYLSLISLRQTGSKLPVEVVMTSYEEYEEDLELCSTFLPKLNASCVILPKELGSQVMDSWPDGFRSYQFKSLALMVSSFQNVLLLDSDNIPIENPDSFFTSVLYQEYGLITWPDYWQRTISPLFYNISGVEVNLKKRVRYNRLPLGEITAEDNLSSKDLDEVPFHDLEGSIPNLSTESGQILINKASHSGTLLLSLYYNVYGPKLYYKLFSLGELGEGDKDTFVAAATVKKQKYYQLKSAIKPIGHYNKDPHFQGKVMAQKNPILDHQLFLKEYGRLKDETSKVESLKDKIEIASKILKDKFGSDNEIPIFTMHCHYPKLDPTDIMKRKSIYDEEAKRLNYRMYKGFSYKRNLQGEPSEKIDFELQQWENMQTALCIEQQNFSHLKTIDREELCEFIMNQVAWLSEDTSDTK